MKISVIAIFYNSEKYIRKCLDSILEQKNVELEIIAVNDCSPDSTGNILNDYASLYDNVVIVNHQVNKGISEARNSGMEKVSGDCFYFIDGDDYLSTPYALSHLASKYSQDVDFVQGSYQKCDENDKNIRGGMLFKNGTYESFSDICNNFGVLNFYYTHNKLINAKYKDIKFKPGCYHEDRMWIVEIFNNLSKVVATDIITYNYVIRADQESNKARSTQRYIDSGMILMKMMSKCPDCWRETRDTFQIVDIEKPLYLWMESATYRKKIRRELKLLNTTTISTKGFPRFTRLVHFMIESGFPDLLINMIAKSYFLFMTKFNRPI